MSDTDVPCLVAGCDYQFDPTDDDWHETYEQHVRWIHVRERDFGEEPMPTLTMLMFHGFLRPEEFAEYAQEILNREWEKIRVNPPLSSPWFTGIVLFLAVFFGAAMVAAAFQVRHLQLFVVEALAVATGIALFEGGMGLVSQWRYVRRSSYPDTDVGDVTDAEKETE